MENQDYKDAAYAGMRVAGHKKVGKKIQVPKTSPKSN